MRRVSAQRRDEASVRCHTPVSTYRRHAAVEYAARGEAKRETGRGHNMIGRREEKSAMPRGNGRREKMRQAGEMASGVQVR